MKTYVPKPYQLQAIAAATCTRHLALFLDPGLGKTSITLRTFVNLRRRKQVKGLLVIAPLRPCYAVWPEEVKKWHFSRHLKVRVLHGRDRLWQLQQPADIYVINPEGLKWLFTVALKGKREYPFDMLTVDESGKFRNPDSKRLRIVKPKLKKFKRRYILNGTPAPNGVPDLFSQFLIVDQGETFGRTITHFRNQYLKRCGYMGKQWEIASDSSREAVYERAAHMCLVVEAKDHLDMPPITYHDIAITLPPAARQHYDEMEKELFTMIDNDEIEAANAATAMMACRQMASGGMYQPTPEGMKPFPANVRPWWELHRKKDEALIDLMDELQHKPVLIAYEFHHDYQRIRDSIRKAFGFEVAHPGTGKYSKAGPQLERDWNNGKIRALAGHPNTIALGLNLQECGEDIFWYSLTENLENYIQLIQRLWRQGFKGSSVRVHHCIATDTVDEAILARLTRKDRNQLDLKTALKAYRDGKRKNKFSASL